MTNIVIVKQSFKNYLFSVPMGTTLKKNDKVVCDTARGEQEGICFTDSFIVEADALNQIALLTGATLPLKSVIGKSEIVRFKDKPQVKQFKVGEKYTAGKFMYYEGGNVIEITDIIGEYCHYQTIAGKYIPEKSATKFAIYSPFAYYLIPYTEEETVIEVERQAKINEWIKVKNTGDIKQIKRYCETDGNCMVTMDGSHYYKEKYVVLENYTPTEEQTRGTEKHTYKVGDKVEIIRERLGHEFAIGTKVKLISKDDETWKATGLNKNGIFDYWFIREDDFKPYTEPTKHVYKEGDYVKIISNELNSFELGYIVKLNYKADNGWWNCTWTGFDGVSKTQYANEYQFKPFNYDKEKIK